VSDAGGDVPVRTLLERGAQRLRDLDSPQADAAALLAFAWNTDAKGLARARLMGDEVPAQVVAAYHRLLGQRAARVPVQHLTGVAHFRTLSLPVGPGVFIPRPETELLVSAVIDAVRERGLGAPHVIDLCAGSGAIGLAAAAEVPGAQVVAIEIDPAAVAWARRAELAAAPDIAAAGSTFTLRCGDAGDPDLVAGVVAAELAGRVDIVVSNPPYVLADGTTTAAEVLGHDPAVALWGGGDDGMEMPTRIIAAAAAALAADGLLVIEHADTQGAAVRAVAADCGFRSARTQTDYTGRDRFTIAVR